MRVNWPSCWLRWYLEGNHYNVAPRYVCNYRTTLSAGQLYPFYVLPNQHCYTRIRFLHLFTFKTMRGKSHIIPYQFQYLCLNSVASLRPEQRLTHFVSLCNKAAMISLLAFCGYLCTNNICGKPSIAVANIGRVSSYQHRLASSLPGLRSSTFIQADT